MHVPADKYHKLDVKAIEVMFIRYESGSKGYRLWDKCTCSIHLSQDVTFDKSSFPSLSGDEPCPAPTPPLILVIAVPNPATKPSEQDPSPAPSNSSKEEVNDTVTQKTVPMFGYF